MPDFKIKTLLKRALNALGFEILRAENAVIEAQVLKNVLHMGRVEIVLDVGANAGQFGDRLFETGFRGMLLSFEAIPSVHAELVKHAKKRSPSWLVAPCAAIGRQRGQIEMNVAANSVSSSILPMNKSHLDAAPESRYVEKQTVNLERLDELASRYLAPAGDLFIKIDTQGYELEVLAGATGLLPRTAAMQLEISLVPLYEGAPTFTEMVSFVESNGFELFSIVPGFSDKQSGRLLQVDGFFVRAKSPP